MFEMMPIIITAVLFQSDMDLVVFFADPSSRKTDQNSIILDAIATLPTRAASKADVLTVFTLTDCKASNLLAFQSMSYVLRAPTPQKDHRSPK